MPARTLRRLLLGAALTLAHPALAEGPWLDWPVERNDGDQGVTYATEPDDPDAARAMVLDVPAPGEDPEADLQDALAVLWLEMNEVEGQSEEDGRLVIWGDVDAEHGERRFAAAIEPTGEGARVTALVALPDDFERLGGAGALGVDEAAQMAAAPEEDEEAAPVETAEETGAPRRAARSPRRSGSRWTARTSWRVGRRTTTATGSATRRTPIASASSA